MDLAIDRIAQAIQSGEKILIYGDYDVDGTTAVALTYSFFGNTILKLISIFLIAILKDTVYPHRVLTMLLRTGIPSLSHSTAE